MCFCNSGADGKPKSGTMLFVCDKGLEDMCDPVRRDAAAIVLYTDGQKLMPCRDFKEDRRSPAL